MFNFVTKTFSCFLLFSYICLVVDTPLVAYAVSGRDIVQSTSKDTALNFSNLPFATKTHIVMAAETVANLCKHYNLSRVGFNNLNAGRFTKHTSNKKLEIGSTVIVPIRPLSNAMSHYLDGQTQLASSVSAYASSVGELIDSTHNNKLDIKNSIKKVAILKAEEALSAKVTA